MQEVIINAIKALHCCVRVCTRRVDIEGKLVHVVFIHCGKPCVQRGETNKSTVQRTAVVTFMFFLTFTAVLKREYSIQFVPCSLATLVFILLGVCHL